MEQYDRLVEFVDPSDNIIYFHQEKGIFLNKIPSGYVPLRKDILLGSALSGRKMLENEIYPTGVSYMLCESEHAFFEDQTGAFPTLKLLEDEDDTSYLETDNEEQIFYSIKTPGTDNNCLVYAIVLSHPKMNKNLKSNYISKLKERLIEYCILRFTETYGERKKEIDEYAERQIQSDFASNNIQGDLDILAMLQRHRESEYVFKNFVKNSDIPKELKNRDSLLGYYLEQIPDDSNDYVFTENLFDICKNRYADSLLLGEYIAEFFKINIVYYVDPRTGNNENAQVYRVEYIKDEEWDTIYIYLKGEHFSNICRLGVTLDECTTQNII